MKNMLKCVGCVVLLCLVVPLTSCVVTYWTGCEALGWLCGMAVGLQWAYVLGNGMGETDAESDGAA